MRTSSISVLAAAAVLTLAACSGTSGSTTTSTTSAGSAAPSATSSQAAADATSSASSSSASSSAPSSAPSSAADSTSAQTPAATTAAPGANAALAKRLTAGGLYVPPANIAAMQDTMAVREAKRIDAATFTPAECDGPVKRFLHATVDHTAMAAAGLRATGTSVNVLQRGSADEAKAAVEALTALKSCPVVKTVVDGRPAELRLTVQPWQVKGADAGYALAGQATGAAGTLKPFYQGFLAVDDAVIDGHNGGPYTGEKLDVITKTVAALNASK